MAIIGNLHPMVQLAFRHYCSKKGITISGEANRILHNFLIEQGEGDLGFPKDHFKQATIDEKRAQIKAVYSSDSPVLDDEERYSADDMDD